MENKKRNNFKGLRVANGYTQEELAKKVGITSRTLGFYEVGKRSPNIKVAKKIADLFEKSIDEVFFNY